MKNCLIAVVSFNTLSLLGCATNVAILPAEQILITEVGADWDDEADKETSITFIAGYKSLKPPYKKEVHLKNIPKGAKAGWVACKLVEAWNAKHTEQKAYLCPRRPTLAVFPGADCFWVEDGAKVRHELKRLKRRIHGDLRVRKISCPK